AAALTPAIANSRENEISRAQTDDIATHLGINSRPQAICSTANLFEVPPTVIKCIIDAINRSVPPRATTYDAPLPIVRSGVRGRATSLIKYTQKLGASRRSRVASKLDRSGERASFHSAIATLTGKMSRATATLTVASNANKKSKFTNANRRLGQVVVRFQKVTIRINTACNFSADRRTFVIET